MKPQHLLATFVFLFSLSSLASVNNEKVGVLLLAHGGKHASWDESVTSATNKLRQKYIVEVAFGMADPVRMQTGIDKLETQGVTKIVVVPLFISSYSPIIRQNEFLLGFRKSLADPPLLMRHYKDSAKNKKHSSDHSYVQNEASQLNDKLDLPVLEPLKFKAELILTKPLDSHPLVAEILFERIIELSVEPEVETVLVVAHGPDSEEDNLNWLKAISELIEQLRILQADKSLEFKQIYGMTVRDDADTEIYAKAKAQFRAKVSQSAVDGDAIVIPLLLSQGGVEARYVKRLEGLDYKWSGKTLLPHPNITKFIQVSVENALED